MVPFYLTAHDRRQQTSNDASVERIIYNPSHHTIPWFQQFVLEQSLDGHSLSLLIRWLRQTA